ncbi:G2/mitotic-specific cyclin-2-like isoform X2 [Magnolia sinica]|uniref:G2/mitotic-specific cyclin-2-like isoform X2 n=1 Tax=Magnolia sinica TaxID=86752 RepID=UPI002658593B|nr:G2/mitotic-specific cyclin-2-like isoform X2 [Magnolia sinica]
MASRPSGNRRALGDIGNIVGALSATYLVTKPQHQQQQNHTNNLIEIDRPTTRKFGAELTAKNQLHGKATKIIIEDDPKQSRTASSRKKRNRIPEIHEPKSIQMGEEEEEQEKENTRKKKLERWECGSSFNASMSTETAELPLDSEVDLQEWCEVEMEEAESPLRCIDKSDFQNPLAVVEYIDDIYSFYHRTEINSCVPTNYMSNQTDINHKMRAILVDWLIEVHYKFELMHETLFLAINIIDRYLSRQGVMRKYLQLVGVTGMLLACKYEEICVPLLEDFIYISDGAYTRVDVLKMEKSMLNTLQFNMSVPTPFVFMKRFLKAAESDTKLEMVSFYLMELCMVEYQMLKFPPSLLSAAAVYAGRCMLRRSPTWTKTLRHHSTYSEDQLQECVRLIVELHQNAGQGKLTSVYRKYSFSKNSCIAILMKTTTIETHFHSN